MSEVVKGIHRIVGISRIPAPLPHSQLTHVSLMTYPLIAYAVRHCETVAEAQPQRDIATNKLGHGIGTVRT
jgi:hypothetical protein